MKIALCSSYVPFINGGYRNIVEWLMATLKEHGHQVEVVYLPENDHPDNLFRQMTALRWIDLEVADRIICFRPQAHLIPHPNKILWFIHHIRTFYDLWDTPYRGFPDDQKHKAIRDALHATDKAALLESKHIYTNSKVVSERLKSFNGIDSEVLYPPVFQSERFYRSGFNDEIVCICRIEHHKRQHLLIEAMQYTKTPVKLRLAGASSVPKYVHDLKERIDELGVNEKVALDNRWISEQEKVNLLADCLAAAYLPFDEDSYGYPSVEASHAQKPILTTWDSGGVLELVEDSINGFVAEPAPEAIAQAMDEFFSNRNRTQHMGDNAAEKLRALNISWSHVAERLLR